METQALTFENTLTKFSPEIAVFEEKWNSISTFMNTNNNRKTLLTSKMTMKKCDQLILKRSTRKYQP